MVYVLDKLSFYLYDFKFNEKLFGVDLASASLDWLVAFDNEFKGVVTINDVLRDAIENKELVFDQLKTAIEQDDRIF